MAKINGIGGVFITMTKDAEKLKKWYKEVLELDMTDWGVNFLEPNIYTLITLEKGEKNDVFLNFTVDNLDEYLAKITKKGVKIVKDVKEYDYGMFVTVEDIVGNKLELWEPYKEGYKKMVLKELEDFENTK